MVFFNIKILDPKGFLFVQGFFFKTIYDGEFQRKVERV